MASGTHPTVQPHPLIMNRTVVTDQRLHLRSPYRLFGAVRIVYSLAIAAIGLAAIPGLRDTYAQLIELPAANDPPTPAQTIDWAMHAIGALCCVIVFLKHFGGGIKNLLVFFVPVGVPKDLHASADTAGWLFKRRTIALFINPRAIMRRAMSRLSPRFEYATPPVERLLGAALARGPWVGCALLFGAAWLARSAIPLPWAVLAVVLCSRLLYLLAVFAVSTSVPHVEVAEVREHIARTSNPMNFFLHLERQVQQLRHETFPNRTYLQAAPQITGAAPGITSVFSGSLLVETQPVPLPNWKPFGAALLCGGGIALGCAGIGVLLHLPTHTSLSAPALALHCLLPALVALSASKRMLGHALALLQVFRFRSLLLSCELQGTYTSSAIGVGDGRGGQFFAERQSIQSDTGLVAYAASIVTECHGPDALHADRYLISTDTDAVHRQAFNGLMESLRSYRDSTTSLPAIALDDPAVAQLVNANLQIVAGSARASAQALDAPNGPVALIAGSAAAPTEEGAWKTCPECGERIREAARKCRFCNFRFDNTGASV